MSKHGALLLYHAFPILLVAMSLVCRATCDDRKVYIVYLGSLSDGFYSPSSHHLSILQRVVQGSSPENVLVRSYKRSFNGFAARLNDLEREKLANMKDVVSVFPSRTLQLQTTRSWDFMGFDEKIGRKATVVSDIIVGVIDSGIWPESESFKDEGFGPPPKKWKGACAGGKNFTCNNKLIGARYYSSTESARDDTVAASSMDRRIIDKVALGNGKTIVGNSVNSFTLNGTSFPLIHGKDVSRNCTEKSSGDCGQGCLDRDIVKGKVVLCDNYGLLEPFQSGALGSILPNFRAVDDASYVLPLAGMTINNEQYNVVMSYMNSTRDPRVNILKSEVIKNPAAPLVASFSARGPNLILPNIIKPDISAPGIEILAAFSSSPISTTPGDMRRVKYNIQSGTSMSCPHAAGVAAYIKTIHPDWSPAAIKSSLMTTAWLMNDPSSNVSTGEFAYGSGHINPVKAIDPGLVYDASKEDYVELLCMNYDESRVRLVSGDNSTCPTGSGKGSPKDHNYPSMGAKVTAMQPFTVTFNRRVKNVGLANSTYVAKLSPNSKLDIKVVPEVLSFKSLNEEKTFNVTVAGSGLPFESRASASLVWSDGTRSVRSPIVVYTLPRA
ncbi:hypothetical protein M0R45_017288 [Rubus argutus]|uniref:Cucumisin n=1 Tax=Rubus argutus TaxID=59490 RepID=A0AAW1XVR1_RUBAR